METSGFGGGGASNLREDSGQLAGVLASEDGTVTYPEDRCLMCEREGVHQSATCFHRHWKVADENGNIERRGGAVA